jgi:hypothetical protein
MRPRYGVIRVTHLERHHDLAVYVLFGRRDALLVDGCLNASRHYEEWDGREALRY